MIAFLDILQKRTAPVGQGKLHPSFLPALLENKRRVGADSEAPEPEDCASSGKTHVI